MIALLITAQLAAAVPHGAQPAARETPNLYREEPRCASVRRHVMERLVPSRAQGSVSDGRAFRRLDELPRANLEYAVLRSVEGCMVPAPVGYRQDYLLPGAADPKPQAR
jgi:hypothetical protein